MTQGRKLRPCVTCVPTEIHHPTDGGLLVDSVRVLSWLIKQAKAVLQAQRASVRLLYHSC